jgi:nitroreductase
MQITKLINGYPFISYKKESFNGPEMLARSRNFLAWMDSRRTVRDFSEKAVDREVIENILMTASTAPSGAHKQPWTFCAINDPEIKKQIRMAAETEEKENYTGRMPQEWIRDLAPLGTGWEKPFLERAPWLIAVFRRIFETEGNGHKHQNYYVMESCGLACGFLLAAIHQCGLVALTHTPSPMNFLSGILNRPPNEKPFLLIPVGYPADECLVPDIKRKGKDSVIAWYT